MKDLTSLRLSDLSDHEWKLTNRLGAYSSSTVAAMNTRRSHGLLVAPIARGAQRLVFLSRAEESLRAPNKHIDLACNEYPGTTFPRGDQFLRSFSEDSASPAWTYAGDGWSLAKSIHLLDDQNTVILSYTLTQAAAPMEFSLRPLFALRPQRDLAFQWHGHLAPEKRTLHDYRIPATHQSPEAFFSSDGSFDPKGCWYYSTLYRGQPGVEDGGLEDLWSPGLVNWTLSPNQSAHFVCSTDPVCTHDALESLHAPAKRTVTAQVSDLVRTTRAQTQRTTRAKLNAP
jgi:predicted glycogen debranching enzyme